VELKPQLRAGASSSQSASSWLSYGIIRGFQHPRTDLGTVEADSLILTTTYYAAMDHQEKVDKKGKHHRVQFWKNRYPKPSSEPSTSHSSLPIPVANASPNSTSPDTAGTSQGIGPIVSGAIAPDQSRKSVAPDTGGATTTVTAPALRADTNYPSVSRTENWLGRATLLLKVTKDVTEAAGILAPLKAACGATITLLEAVQVRESLYLLRRAPLTAMIGR
jgi:hypothetical protein